MALVPTGLGGGAMLVFKTILYNTQIVKTKTWDAYIPSTTHRLYIKLKLKGMKCEIWGLNEKTRKAQQSIAHTYTHIHTRTHKAECINGYNFNEGRETAQGLALRSHQ